MIDWVRDLSFTLRAALTTLGATTLFFLDLVSRIPRVFVRRFGLVVAQIYNAGTLSLTEMLELKTLESESMRLWATCVSSVSALSTKVPLRRVTA